jgi:aspartate/methionine/tyrosine aminotransferase
VEALLAFAAEHDLMVISDEVYRDLVYAAAYTSAAHFRQHRSRVVTVASFSKGVAMTGWRLGYVAGDADLMARVAQFQLHTITCASSVAQHAAAAALAAGDIDRAASDIRLEYGRRRKLVEAALGDLPQVDLAPMEGTPFAWVGVGRLTANAAQFTTRLRRDYGVSVVPGSAFPGGEGYVRLCYAKAPADRLRVALERFRSCVETWA